MPIRILAMMFMIGLAASCSGDSPPTRNVILIGVDTLRADALGVYNGQNDSSPNIDAFAESGTTFSSVTSAAPWTLPSFTSLFTGLYPESHGVTDQAHRLADSVDTLAEVFSQNGFRTAAFTAGGHVGIRNGLQDGFQVFNRRSPSKKFEDRIPPALRWLDEENGKPFFVFVHGYDTHVPYSPHRRPDPPDGFVPPSDETAGSLMTYFGSENPKTEIPVGEIQTSYLTLKPERMVDFRKAFFRHAATIKPSLEAQWQQSEHYENELNWVKANYRAEVRELDEQLGVLFKELEKRDLLDSTLIVLISDHGESFMEHQRLDHNHVDEEVARVPLVIRLPEAQRQDPPPVVNLPVRSIDVAPTILDYCGIQTPVGFQGRSLRPLLEGGDLPDEAAACFQHNVGSAEPEISIRSGDWKLITGGKLSQEYGGDRLFNLATDPLELNNLYRTNQRRVDLLERMLKRIQQANREIASHHDPSIAPLDDDARQELIELGYLGRISEDE